MELINRLITSIEQFDEETFGKLADDIPSVRKEYSTEQEEKRRAASNVKTLTEELEKVRNTPTIPKSHVDELERTLISVQTQLKSKDALSIKLPIIAEDIKFTDSRVIVLREVKTAIYMNKLLEFIRTNYRLRQKTENKKYLLLVLDPLSDEFRLAKYKKHSYPINEVVKDIPMLISNEDLSAISKLVDLSSYSEITIVDRYQKIQSAVKHPKADTYYLIDSLSDTIDYNLDRTRCIAFINNGESIFNYVVDPSVDINIYSNMEKPGAIGSCSFVGRFYCNEV